MFLAFCMRKFFTLLLTMLFFTGSCFAQLFVEPIVGYQTDLDTHPYKYSMINTGVQFAFKYKRHYELLVKVQQSWGQTSHYSGNAFTTNPALPPTIEVQNSIKPSVFSFAIGHRFKIPPEKAGRSNVFSILLYTGVAHQKIAVDYDYDKANYIVLNAEQTQQRWGVYISAGLEYMRKFENGRLFVQSLITSPASGSSTQEYSSLGFNSLLSFNAGYSFMLQQFKKSRK